MADQSAARRNAVASTFRFLSAARVIDIHGAAIELGLATRQNALLGGIDQSFVAGLPEPSHISLSERLLDTLHRLNEIAGLADGTVPFEIWLRNAETLAASHPGSDIFAVARGEIAARHRPVTPITVDGQHGTSSGAEIAFRRAVIERFGRLAVRLPSTDRSELPLEAIYVDLNLVADIPQAADTFGPDERRLLAELGSATGLERTEKQRQIEGLKYSRWRRPGAVSPSFVRSFLDCVVHASQPLVVLGDPGSGKSTALQWLAIRAARDGRVNFKGTDAERADWLPIFVPLAAYDEHFSKSDERLRLTDFLAASWSAWETPTSSYRALFTEALRDGRALVLLDGLDEVLTRARRDHVNEQIRAFFNSWAPFGNRFVVTSRFIGYREAPLSGDIEVVSVIDFGIKEIEQFLTSWHGAFDGERAAARKKALLDQIKSAPRLRDLAANPLMLSMLAKLHSQRAEGDHLPERRVELYQEFTTMMLSLRPDTRSEGVRTQGVPRTDPTTVRAHLMDLALWLQHHQPSNTASRQKVLDTLVRSFLEHGSVDSTKPTPKERLHAQQGADELLDELRQIAGLIAERGPGAYGFLHLTYQEFFAGGALARLSSEKRWEAIRPNLHSPRWRETILLCAGWLGGESRQLVDDLVESVLGMHSEHEDVLHRDVFLAAAIVAEGVSASPAVRSRVHHALVALLADHIRAVREKALNGIINLARLGHDESIALLTELLQREPAQDETDPSHNVHGAVADILTTPACRRLLDITLHQLEAWSADSQLAWRPARALGMIAQADDAVRAKLISIMIRNPPTAATWNIMNALDSLIDEHEDVRNAFWQLTRSSDYGQPAISGMATNCSLVPELRRLLETHWSVEADRSVRDALVPAIGKVAREDARWLRTLIECAADKDHNTRIHSIAQLGTIAADIPEAKRALLTTLASTRPNLSHASAMALSPLATTDAEVRAALLSIADNVSCIDARQSALSALGTAAIRPGEAAIFEKYFYDPEDVVRRTAKRALASSTGLQIDLNRIAQLLDNVSCHTSHQGVDAIAPLVLLDERIRNDIITCLDDPDLHVRASAVSALAPLMSQSIPLRARVVDCLGDPSRIVCMAAVRALSEVVRFDDDARSRILRVAVSSDEWKAKTAADALVSVASLPEVRAVLLQLFEQGDGPERVADRVAAARALATLVPDDTEVRDLFRKLALDLASMRIDAYHCWTTVSMLDDVVERDDMLATFLRGSVAALGAPFPILVLAVRHAYGLHLDLAPAINSWRTDDHHLFAAVVRGALQWYHSQACVRDYILRCLGRASMRDETIDMLMPLVSGDDELRTAFARRAIVCPSDGRGGVECLSRLVPYVDAHSDLEEAFRGLFDQSAPGHFGCLRRVIAAAGLSSVARRDASLRMRLLPWLGARVRDPDATGARRVIARNLAALIPEDASFATQVTKMLDSPAWQDRQGAAWILAHGTSERSTGLIEKLRGLIRDTRADESWLERLEVADVFLNHHDPDLSGHAMAVAMEALGYGKNEWCEPLGEEVRAKAAEVLGKLQPMYCDQSLIAEIRAALQAEISATARNALYNALLQLVSATAPRGS